MMDSLRSASRNTMFDSWLESAMAGGMARAPTSALMLQVRLRVCCWHQGELCRGRPSLACMAARRHRGESFAGVWRTRTSSRAAS